MRRILWNRRPGHERDGGEIDELVISDVELVHIEQMADDCWWIGIRTDGGGWWGGNFTAVGRGRMKFWEQEPPEGFEWDIDQEHT